MFKDKREKKMNEFKKGFTLIEMLVAIGVFVFVLGATSYAFIVSSRNQKTVLAQQFLLDQSNYAIEYMSRALRMAKKELNCLDPSDKRTCRPYQENPPYCLEEAGYGSNYEITRGGMGIKFINPMKNYACQEFFLEDGVLKEKITKPQERVQELPLLSKMIKINRLTFMVLGVSQDDLLQPKVVLVMELEVPKEKIKMNIETTISQRDLDIKQ
jgi:prepilin-type N-terminal cleavage/methylation domain-containing protein